jgi:hypothetical protein
MSSGPIPSGMGLCVSSADTFGRVNSHPLTERKPLWVLDFIKSVDSGDIRWLDGHFMRNNLTTATMGTTATAVAFTYASTVVDHAYAMWSSPAANHANKRRTRQPRGFLI